MSLRARALTADALVSLRTTLDQADSPVDFLAEADGVINDPQNLLELPFDTGEPSPLAPGADRDSGRDVDNGPAVYEYLGAMDRANASDERLWTYLALAAYRPYMSARWPLHTDRNWKRRAERRWLMSSVHRGSLVRHGIARLWWVTSLTYDPTCRYRLSAADQDPFAYTRAVLHNEDRINALFDREVGAVAPLVRCVLEHAAENPLWAKDDHIRAVMKELTLIYGYRDLASLNDQQLRDLVYRFADAQQRWLQARVQPEPAS
jgi:hypothetical protein